MSRISAPAAPAAIDAAAAAAQPLLHAVKRETGAIPNMFLMLANSPAALQGYLGLDAALAQGSISPETRARIALAVAEINGCDYCLSARTYLARTRAKLDNAEITANRSGASNDLHADAAVRFAAKIVRRRGQVSAEDVSAFRAAGYSDAAVFEVIALTALSSFANYLNQVTRTEIDFPRITARRAA